MDQRELRRKLRQSNIVDLLDDGIENGSDLRVPSRVDEDAQGPDAGDANKESFKRLEQSSGRRAAPPEPREIPKASVNYAGLAIGTGFAVSGALIFPDARAINILHGSLRYRPAWIEHLTATESRVYALVAIVFGIALCAFSLYRPRR
jgi:hypothetical protein